MQTVASGLCSPEPTRLLPVLRRLLAGAHHFQAVRRVPMGFAGCQIELALGRRALHQKVIESIAADPLASPDIRSHISIGEAADYGQVGAELRAVAGQVVDGVGSIHLEEDGLHCVIECPIGARGGAAPLSIQCFDTRSLRGAMIALEPEGFPGNQRAVPLRHIACWLAPFAGVQPVHAASVARVRRRDSRAQTETPEYEGLVLVGPSGAGKSTCTTVCSRSGLHTVGDDYIALSGEQSGVTARSLFRAAKLDIAFADRLWPYRPDWKIPPNHGVQKAALHFDRFAPRALIPHMRVLAFVHLTKRTDSAAHWQPTCRVEILAALGATSALQQAGFRQQCLSRCAELVHHLPCYALDAGPSPQALPGVMTRLMEELSERRSSGSRP